MSCSLSLTVAGVSVTVGMDLVYKTVRWTFVALLVVLTGMCAPTNAAAEDAVIDGFSVTNDNGVLTLEFYVKNCFNQKMEEAIKAGVPTTFNFLVKVYKKRSVFWNRKLANHRFTHTVVYDNIQKDYRVTLEEAGEELRAKTLEEAKELMARVANFGVIEEQLLTEGRYRIAVKAELDPVRLPLRMEFVLFFVSLWDFDTDWYEHDFRVTP